MPSRTERGWPETFTAAERDLLIGGLIDSVIAHDQRRKEAQQSANDPRFRRQRKACLTVAAHHQEYVYQLGELLAKCGMRNGWPRPLLTPELLLPVGPKGRAMFDDAPLPMVTTTEWPSPREAPLELCKYGYAAWAHVVHPIACHCGFAPASPPPAPPSGDFRALLDNLLLSQTGGDIPAMRAARAAVVEAHERERFAARYNADAAAQLEATRVELTATVERVEKERDEAVANHENLLRTVDYQAKVYLTEHGGSWGLCKWQAENASLRATVATLERALALASKLLAEYQSPDARVATLEARLAAMVAVIEEDDRDAAEQSAKLEALEARLGALTEAIRLADLALTNAQEASNPRIAGECVDEARAALSSPWRGVA